jgi:hypothetical protein
VISLQKVDSLLDFEDEGELKSFCKRPPVAGRPGRSLLLYLRKDSAFPITCPPAGGEAIMSQFRVWPFLPTAIAVFGERNRNPGHFFAGD